MQEPIRIATVDQFRKLLDSEMSLVITDAAGDNEGMLHSDPAGCV